MYQMLISDAQVNCFNDSTRNNDFVAHDEIWCAEEVSTPSWLDTVDDEIGVSSYETKSRLARHSDPVFFKKCDMNRLLIGRAFDHLQKSDKNHHMAMIGYCISLTNNAVRRLPFFGRQLFGGTSSSLRFACT